MTKPAYKIPTMKQVAKAKGTNGLTMVSTFSGGGGSCLGFEMAGFTVAWANEFIEEARATYSLNHPGVQLDPRDIREVTGAQIMTAVGLQRGELDLLEGSPPCAAFSTAGVGNKGWGKVRKYSDGEQRVDDLFFEYARLVDELRPKVFVAENVYGLVRGKGLGYFKHILAALKEPGYRVEAKLLDGSWLGVPQARKRLIFVGVREDLPGDPPFPKPLSYSYSVEEVLPHVKYFAVGAATTDKNWTPAENWKRATSPSQTIMASDGGVGTITPHFSGGAGFIVTTLDIPEDPETGHKLYPGPAKKAGPATTLATEYVKTLCGKDKVVRAYTLEECRVLCSFPADFELTGTYQQRWERLGRSVPPLMAKAIAEPIRDYLLSLSD